MGALGVANAAMGALGRYVLRHTMESVVLAAWLVARVLGLRLSSAGRPEPGGAGPNQPLSAQDVNLAKGEPLDPGYPCRARSPITPRRHGPGQ
jgi:hypothetical protein